MASSARGWLVVGVTILLGGCGPGSGTASPVATVDLPLADPAGPPPPQPAAPAAVVVADDAPLGDGLQTFEGMVRPTKGGLDVRGVLLEDDTLPRALGPMRGASLLGARVRITADLVHHPAAAPPADGLAVQTRSGPWVGVRRIASATVVAPPVVIEGELGRTKGLVSIGSHLVHRDDLEWSLAGQGGWKPGDRVRLAGQPRVVHCRPHEQCLVGGSLPMFDVGSAEKLGP